MNTRLLALLALLVLIALALSACVPGPNPLENVPPEGKSVAGFWLGFWHGIVAPVAFTISIFKADVSVYEVHNNGFWYNMGFVLSAGVLVSSTSTVLRQLINLLASASNRFGRTGE